jgi:hypothetical protein
MSLESWNGWVIEQRQEYSVRLKSGRATSGSGCSSSQWPTTITRDWKDTGDLSLSAIRKDGKTRLDHLAHRVAHEQIDLCRPDQSSGGGNQAESSTLAAKDLWQTPDVGSVAGGRSARGQSEPHKASLEKQAIHETPMIKTYWPTPQAHDAQGGKTPVQALETRERTGAGVSNLNEEIHLWPTPSVPNGGRQPAPGISATGVTLDGKKRQVELAHAVQKHQIGQPMWATPRSGMSAGSNDVEWKPGQKPTKDGKPITTSLTDQVKLTEQMWPTIRASDGENGGPNMRGSHGDFMLPSAVNHWMTPRSSEAAHSGRVAANHGGQTGLAEQTKALATKTGKLNPRWVETLMGLPVGWTMPSCANPWTIALTNSDSSETALTPMLPPKRS